jgi:hypothetical protein
MRDYRTGGEVESSAKSRSARPAQQGPNGIGDPCGQVRG